MFNTVHQHRAHNTVRWIADYLVKLKFDVALVGHPVEATDQPYRQLQTALTFISC